MTTTSAQQAVGPILNGLVELRFHLPMNDPPTVEWTPRCVIYDSAARSWRAEDWTTTPYVHLRTSKPASRVYKKQPEVDHLLFPRICANIPMLLDGISDETMEKAALKFAEFHQLRGQSLLVLNRAWLLAQAYRAGVADFDLMRSAPAMIPTGSGGF